MFDIFLSSLKIKYSYSANRLIHFLRHIPLIKKLIRPDIYEDYDLKKAFAVLAFSLSCFKKIFLRFFYFFLIFLLALFIYSSSVYDFTHIFINENPLEGMTFKSLLPYITVIWLLFTIFGSLMTNNLCGSLDYNRDDMMINYFRLNPVKYAKTKIINTIISSFLIYFPIFLLLFIIGFNAIYAFTLIFILFFVRLLGINFYLLLHKTKNKTSLRSSTSLILLVLLLVLTGLFPLYSGIIDLFFLLGNPFFLLLFIVASVFLFCLAYKYQGYSSFIRMSIATYNEIIMSVEKNQRGQIGAFVNKWDKNLDKNDVLNSTFDNKSGFAYLNAIFFARHAKFLRKKLIIKVIAILSVGIIVSAVILIGVKTNNLTMAPAKMYNINNSDFFKFMPASFFIIYSLSTGRVVTACIFGNCDIQMLNYPYYRTKQTIFASFKSRFLYIARGNFILTASLFISVVFPYYCFFGEIFEWEILMLFILFITIGILFSFHDLFLYYVIQPYDIDGNNKSVFHTIITIIISIIAYINLNMNLSFIPYLITILIFTTIYLIIGLFLLSKYAPKNFKLR